MNQLLIATNNQGKLIEIQHLLTDVDVELITPTQINLDLDIVEDGLTYEENAVKKAVAFAQASGLIALADDSGLEVDALNGEPGLYSARYGSTDGVKLSDAERRKFLIKNLGDKPHPWTAHFTAAIAIAIPDNVTLNEVKGLFSRAETLRSPHGSSLPSSQGSFGRVTLFNGICEGEIIPEERGTSGFGYDPIFLLNDLGKTMAELPQVDKNRLSHRARAVINAREYLKKLFSKSNKITM